MKKALIFVFHSQPELYSLSYFDISKNKDFSSLEVLADEAVLRIKNDLISLINQLGEDKSRSITLALTNPVLTYLQEEKKLLISLNKLIKKNQIELIACPGNNSLSILFSSKLFEYEVTKNREMINSLFNIIPDGFSNSVLMFSDSMATRIKALGYHYCLAPRIPWFIDNAKDVVFKSNTEDLKLILPDRDDLLDKTGPVKVALSNINAKALFKAEADWLKLNELVTTINPAVYKLPDLVAIDYNGQGIDSLVGNNLQRDLLKRLIEVSALIPSSANQSIIDRILWIGSIDHFRALSRKEANDTCYSTYVSLLNMLYEVEINLK